MMNHTEIPIREKNIVLIGFMGVGKTTIGRLVAKKLYRDFIDIDEEIEKTYNMPVTQIFKELGEKKFRQMEREIITKICSNTRLKIIALGGGAYLQEEVRKVCLSKCIVYFLDLSWDSWKERLPLIINSRPVLQNKTLDEIEALFFKRRAAYSLHNSKVSTNDLDPETAANYIVDSLITAWDLYQPLSIVNNE
ncbi:shikimate kinase [Thermoflavimicrobium dichotomicum]|uniref:Shikimate kinase n=1 Tax=Thermoflavimicrobium dichotomicum TaxID=46223 RepID=A0A1I3L266_9BACL|nr:shikimate kinase [Thermoflavimicrobium dichotomicum]SFI78833.1 shikimate kinase [Thermoflavimicrobium dichotomicum]